MSGSGTHKRCGHCLAVLPVESFNWRYQARGRRDNLCRPCRAAYHRKHYLANKQRYVDQARERKQSEARRRTAYLLAFFVEHPCTDCGETDPVVLEFDHLADKRFDIGQALAYRNWEAILAEMRKCDVVCANCHRRRTATRGGHLRARMTESG